MRLVSIFAVTGLVLGMAGAALAEPVPAPSAPTTAPAPAAPMATAKPAKGKKAPSPDDMICEEDAAVTGSMLAHRVCKTRAQRDAETQAGQDSLRNNARMVPGAGRN